MGTTRQITGALIAASLMGAAASAEAQPTLRTQIDVRGDFLLIGNTLAQDCAGGVPAPVVGSVGSCGSSLNDSAPDVYWRADSPVDGQAEADVSIAATAARTSAQLQLPPGATVSYARLYWGGKAASADLDADLSRPGGFSQTVTADDSFVVTFGGDYYQSTADATALVQAQGAGIYRVGGVDSNDIVNTDGSVNFAAWSLVVFYELSTESPRNLALFDGLDTVSNGNDQAATLSGFLVPTAGFDAKLGVITYEGDDAVSGDALRFGQGTLGDADRLSDGVNPLDNFFNASRSGLGTPISIAGDLPQLTGGAGSMSGVDLDVIDVTARLSGGQTSVDIEATSSGDVYFLGAFVTSISTFKPDFDGSTKSVVDVDGGLLLPGDVLEYTIVVRNDGNDPSVDTILTDLLPAGVTYVADSLAITTGPNTGSLTDAVDSDQGELDAGTVTVRLGTGADGSTGGSLDVGESTTVVFRVTVDGDASGTIANQATVTAAGQSGAPSDSTPTDGDGGTPGSQPTDVVIERCDSDAECDGADSGSICETGECEPGCRDQPGSRCPAGEECTATGGGVGECLPVGTGGAGGVAGAGGAAPGGAGGSGGQGGTTSPGGSPPDPAATPGYEGGGVACRATAAGTPFDSRWGFTGGLGLALLLLAGRRRARRLR